MGRTVSAGLGAGLIAGLVSGIMLHLMWVLAPLSLLLARAPNPAVGLIPHLAISSLFGAAFGVIAGALRLERRGAVLAGLITGALAWVVVPMMILPAWIGLPLQFSLASRWLKVGVAYLAYGLVLGGVFPAIRDKTTERRRVT